MSKKTHCKNGHEFTVENTHVRKDGTRDCITCRRAYQKKYQKRVTEAYNSKWETCPKCGSERINSLYRPWVINDPYERIAPCYEEGEQVPCPDREHLHRICECSWWWWQNCKDWNNETQG